MEARCPQRRPGDFNVLPVGVVGARDTGPSTDQATGGALAPLSGQGR